MDQAVWLAKRNYWIAGIGAIVSIVSFLAFPFLTVNISISLPLFGTSTLSDQSVKAVDLASRQGLLWLSLLLAFAVLAVAIVFMVSRNPFGSRVPVQVQAHWTALGFIIAGVLSAIFLVASLLLIQQNEQSALGFLTKIIGADFSVAWAFGVYLFIAGLATIVVAGLLEFISPVTMASDAGMADLPNYAQNQYPPNPYTYPTERYGATPMDQGPYSGSQTQYPGSQPPTQYPPQQ